METKKGGDTMVATRMWCSSIFMGIFFAWGFAYGTGALTSADIEEIQQRGALSPSDRIIMNALTSNKINDLVVNREFIMEHDDYFSHEIDVKGITDQQRSGRCWLFAALNVLRPKIIKRYTLKEFEFSQAYLFFWDKVEKANTFLEWMIATADQDLTDREVALLLKNPITDGGYWSYVVNLVGKYGMMPKSVMPETYNTKNSWYMNDVIARKLRMDAYELREMVKHGAQLTELHEAKITMLGEIYRMLALNFGEPVAEFTWRYETKEGKISEPKKYTPQAFYRDVVGIDLNDYVPLMHYPAKEYLLPYQFEKQRNMYDGKDPVFINVDIDEMKTWVMKSVIDGDPVYFACDIIPDKYVESGILSTRVLDYRSLYGIALDMPKRERMLYRESTSNHAMVFVGVDGEHGAPTKWLVEDSHGTDDGHGGYWTMYNDWFEEYVYVVVIHKQHVPTAIFDILDDEPIVLPLWDPVAGMRR
jgi:bleomycin hydrolase